MPGDFTGSPQWRRIRQQVLERDGYQCQIRGPRCQRIANQVDHIVPVADGGPIYDPANLRAACSACNISRAQRQKQRDGWLRAPSRIALVTGPPLAGKSAYIREHAGPQDLVVDYDALAGALGTGNSDEVRAARNAILRRIRRGETRAPRIWISSADPKAETIYPYHEVILVDPGREKVLERAAGRPPIYRRLIEDWYAHRQKPERREW